MIIPLSQEADWQSTFAVARAWSAPRRNTIVISPHPDDETLATGGFISAQRSKGLDVKVVAVTDGENAYGDNCGLGKIRQQEQEKALHTLGVSATNIIRLGLPDCDVSSYANDVVAALLPFMSEESHIMAPWPGDFHPDHEACGRAAKQAAELCGAQLTFYFFWMWHRGTAELLHCLPIRSFALTSAQQSIKSQALRHHHSQLFRTDGEPILPEYLLWPAKLPFEIYLPA
ncbi:MAG: PIG-L family deacetylase [Acidobacteriaceae bacterium]